MLTVLSSHRLTTTGAAASQTGIDDSARRDSGLVLRLMTVSNRTAAMSLAIHSMMEARRLSQVPLLFTDLT